MINIAKMYGMSSNFQEVENEDSTTSIKIPLIDVASVVHGKRSPKNFRGDGKAPAYRMGGRGLFGCSMLRGLVLILSPRR